MAALGVVYKFTLEEFRLLCYFRTGVTCLFISENIQIDNIQG